MDLPIKPREKSYCFGYDLPECATCENAQNLTAPNYRELRRIDFTQCDLTANTHRVEAAT